MKTIGNDYKRKGLYTRVEANFLLLFIYPKYETQRQSNPGIEIKVRNKKDFKERPVKDFSEETLNPELKAKAIEIEK